MMNAFRQVEARTKSTTIAFRVLVTVVLTAYMIVYNMDCI